MEAQSMLSNLVVAEGVTREVRRGISNAEWWKAMRRAEMSIKRLENTT